MITDLNLKEFISALLICDNCMKEKQQRQLSYVSMIRTTQILELIHSDLIAYLSNTRFEQRYFVIFLNDYTDARWIYTLKLKSQILSTFKVWKTLLKNQTSKTIKRVWFDEKEEYNSHEFDDYFKFVKIKWEFNSSYISEQNDKIERSNAIMKSMRSMLKTKNLLFSLWAEIVKIVEYLKNRSSYSANLNNIISYEMLNDKSSYLEHLRIIEFRIWIHILKKKRKKLNNQSWQSVLIDYERTNQYRVYDLCIDKIHVNKDVGIDETSLYEKIKTMNWQINDEKKTMKFILMTKMNSLSLHYIEFFTSQSFIATDASSHQN
jgi:hypothetical protein